MTITKIIMGHRYKLFISVPKTIVVAILIANSVTSLMGYEEKSDESSLMENKYGRKVRRIMRPTTTTTTEASAETMVGENCIM